VTLSTHNPTFEVNLGHAIVYVICFDNNAFSSTVTYW